MDIQGLQAFLTIADEDSFSGAAERLHLTQPAVSKRISNLEQQLECRLFDRIARKVTLTEAGRALLPRAKHILQQVEETRRVLTDIGGTVSGRLAIGTSHHIGLHRLPPVLRAFVGEYPEVQLDFQFMDSEDAYNAVAQGQLELGIVTLPPGDLGSLNSELIWKDPLSVVVGPEHPLAKADTVSLKLLASSPAILPGPTTFTRKIVEERFAKYQQQVVVSISTNYLETIKMMVSIGLGWSVLPASMVEGELVTLEIPRLRMERSLGVVYHPRHSLSNAARCLLDLLLEQARA